MPPFLQHSSRCRTNPQDICHLSRRAGLSSILDQIHKKIVGFYVCTPSLFQDCRSIVCENLLPMFEWFNSGAKCYSWGRAKRDEESLTVIPVGVGIAYPDPRTNTHLIGSLKVCCCPIHFNCDMRFWQPNLSPHAAGLAVQHMAVLLQHEYTMHLCMLLCEMVS